MKNAMSLTRNEGNRAISTTMVLTVLLASALTLPKFANAQNSAPNASGSGQTYEALTAAHPGWVQVPGQLMPADCVHEIPNGANLEIKDGQVTGDVTLKGQVIAHYDPCSEAPVPTRHLSANKIPGQPPSFNGWVEASQENVS